MSSPMLERLKDFAQRVFVQNRETKLIALLIALGLFVGVRTQEKSDGWVDLDVNVIAPSTEANLALTSSRVASIRVHIRGRASRVNALRAEPALMVTMDLRDRKEAGSFTYFFDAQDLELHDVEVLDIRPEGIPVRLEKVVTATLPVRLHAIGDVPEHLSLSQAPVVHPAKVDVRGAASLVRALEFIETEALDVGDLVAGPLDVPIQLAFVDGVAFQREGYRVRLTLAPKREQRSFADVPIVSEPRLPNARFSSATATVVLSAPKASWTDFDAAKILAQVHVDAPLRTAPGKRPEFAVLVNDLPKDVELVSVEPATVSLLP